VPAVLLLFSSSHPQNCSLEPLHSTKDALEKSARWRTVQHPMPQRAETQAEWATRPQEHLRKLADCYFFDNSSSK
jgi:hypothetical protein